MKFSQRSQLAVKCKLLVEKYETSVLLTTAVEQNIWTVAHAFIAITIATSLLEDDSCSEELEAVSKLSVEDLADVYKILAFWFFLQHDTILVEEVRNVLVFVYEFSDEDIKEMQEEFSKSDQSFIVLYQLLSAAVGKEINYAFFMPHVLNAFKVASSLGE